VPYLSCLLAEVFDAIQNKIVKAETKYGKIPYRVSETEWECRSTAMKTVTQKNMAQRLINIPIIDVGM